MKRACTCWRTRRAQALSKAAGARVAVASPLLCLHAICVMEDGPEAAGELLPSAVAVTAFCDNLARPAASCASDRGAGEQDGDCQSNRAAA